MIELFDWFRANFGKENKTLISIHPQEALESFTFSDKIILISTEVLQKYSKFYFFSLYVLDWYSKGICMNQKAEPHKQSLVVGDQNGIQVLGLCRFILQEFDHNN